MPESVEVDAAGSQKENLRKAEAQDMIRWKVEDPSEFRPELLSDMGKEQSEFRVYNVSTAH